MPRPEIRSGCKGLGRRKDVRQLRGHRPRSRAARGVFHAREYAARAGPDPRRRDPGTHAAGTRPRRASGRSGAQSSRAMSSADACRTPTKTRHLVYTKTRHLSIHLIFISHAHKRTWMALTKLIVHDFHRPESSEPIPVAGCPFRIVSAEPSVVGLPTRSKTLRSRRRSA